MTEIFITKEPEKGKNGSKCQKSGSQNFTKILFVSGLIHDGKNHSNTLKTVKTKSDHVPHFIGVYWDKCFISRPIFGQKVKTVN